MVFGSPSTIWGFGFFWTSRIVCVFSESLEWLFFSYNTPKYHCLSTEDPKVSSELDKGSNSMAPEQGAPSHPTCSKGGGKNNQKNGPTATNEGEKEKKLVRFAALHLSSSVHKPPVTRETY